jgi:hypothetical protein
MPAAAVALDSRVRGVNGGGGGRPRCRRTGSRWRRRRSVSTTATIALDARGRDVRGAVGFQDDGMVLTLPAGLIIGPVSVSLISIFFLLSTVCWAIGPNLNLLILTVG